MKRIILFGQSFLLIAFYCIFCCVALRYTGKSQTYKLYYIDKELEFYVTDEAFAEYKLPMNEFFAEGNSCKNLGKGWSYQENTAIWCIGEESSLFYLVEDTSKDYIMKISIVGGVGYENTLWINDNPIQTLIFEDGIAEVIINHQYLVSGFNSFSIRSRNEILPYSEISSSSADTRKLNLYIKNIETIKCE